MTLLAEQLTAMLAVLAACFIGPGLAIGFLLWRKRRQRSEKRSPISRELLRSPGHSVREQLDEALSDVGFEVMGLALFPVLALALYFAQRSSIKEYDFLTPIYVLAVLCFVAFTIRKLLKLG